MYIFLLPMLSWQGHVSFEGLTGRVAFEPTAGNRGGDRTTQRFQVVNQLRGDDGEGLLATVDFTWLPHEERMPTAGVIVPIEGAVERIVLLPPPNELVAPKPAEDLAKDACMASDRGEEGGREAGGGRVLQKGKQTERRKKERRLPGDYPIELQKMHARR